MYELLNLLIYFTSCVLIKLLLYLQKRTMYDTFKYVM